MFSLLHRLTLFVHLERFKRYSTFCFWLNCPTEGEILRVFWALTPKTSNQREILGGRALTPNSVF